MTTSWMIFIIFIAVISIIALVSAFNLPPSKTKQVLSLSGPFRVTIYSGSQPIETWTVDDNPQADGSAGYTFKTNDGKIMRISGTIIIEPVASSPA